MSTACEERDQKTFCIPSMEELMQYEVHGKPQPIRVRRTSREYSRSYFNFWKKNLPFHSLFHKGTDMNADSNMIKRKCPLESGEEHTVASSSSHECLTRPCTCPDPGQSKEMCVIKKVENWLVGRFLELDGSHEAEEEIMTAPTSMPKWPSNINKRPELEKQAVSALPPSVLLRQVAGALFPVYVLNARVVGIEPKSAEFLDFVRGHCAYYSCNSTITNINWSNSGPLNYGKLARPYCPECCQTRRKRYLSLYFHFELLVEDNLGQTIRVVVARDTAVRFFGCTVYRFLTDQRSRKKIKKMFDILLSKSCVPQPAQTPGVTFDIRIMPVASDHVENVEFHMYGDNLLLSEMARMSSSSHPES